MRPGRGKWILGLSAAATLSVVAAGAVPQGEVAPPEADFLEFLGSWETVDDRWVDPFQDDNPAEWDLEAQTREALPKDARDRRGVPRLKSGSPAASPAPGSPNPREGKTP